MKKKNPPGRMFETMIFLINLQKILDWQNSTTINPYSHFLQDLPPHFYEL